MKIRLQDKFPLSWKSISSSSELSVALNKVQTKLNNNSCKFFPCSSHIFRALELTPLSEVKVVILGQDPYHQPEQANGLAFAVNENINPPPSLINIEKELQNDLGLKKKLDYTLVDWAQQGVLLLNTILTVEQDKPLSHQHYGWDTFTNEIIKAVNNKKSPIVFLLWGANARRKSKLISNSHHLVLKTSHPSPLASYRGFFGCKHFSKASNFLQQSGRYIKWL